MSSGILELFSKQTKDCFAPPHFIVEGGKQEQMRRIFYALLNNDYLRFNVMQIASDQIGEPVVSGEMQNKFNSMDAEELWRHPATKILLKDYLSEITGADPTGKSYVDQIITWWINKSVSFPDITEDVEQIREQLEIFERYKGSEYIPETNINKYKRFSDLAEVTLPLARKAVVSRYTPDDSFTDEEGNEYKLYVTKTPKQTKDLGSGTTWCIQQPKYWKQYIQDGPIAIVAVNDEPTYGIANNGTYWEVQTPENAPHDWTSREKINEWLWGIYQTTLESEYQEWASMQTRAKSDEIKSMEQLEDIEKKLIQMRMTEDPYTLGKFVRDINTRAPVEVEKSIIKNMEDRRRTRQKESPFLYRNYVGDLTRYMTKVFHEHEDAERPVENIEHLTPYLVHSWHALRAYANVPNADYDVVYDALPEAVLGSRPSPGDLSRFLERFFDGDIPPELYRELKKNEPELFSNLMQEMYPNQEICPNCGEMYLYGWSGCPNCSQNIPTTELEESGWAGASEAAMEEAEERLSQEQCSICGKVGLTGVWDSNGNIVGYCENCQTEQG